MRRYARRHDDALVLGLANVALEDCNGDAGDADDRHADAEAAEHPAVSPLVVQRSDLRVRERANGRAARLERVATTRAELILGASYLPRAIDPECSSGQTDDRGADQ